MPIGCPDTVREFLRGYEESGVDEIILLLNPRSHEGTMESIEIMGKEVLPEFIERDEKAVAAKAKRLEPVIEKVEARGRPSKAPAFDENYSFGGLPTGRGGKFTAGEISRGDGRDQRGPGAGGAVGEGEGVDEQEPGGRPMTMGQIDELLRYDGRRVVVTGCASGIGAQVARQLAELGRRGHRARPRAPPADQASTTFIAVDLSDPASIDAAVASIGGQVDALFNVAGVSSGIGDPMLVVHDQLPRHPACSPRRCVAQMPPGSAIANVSSLAASSYRENAAARPACSTPSRWPTGIAWCEAHPEALADGGYRLSKEAIILYGMANVARAGRGHPDQLHRTGRDRDADPRPAAVRLRAGLPGLVPHTAGPGVRRRRTGRGAGVPEQRAASYITGQVIWVDGGTVAERHRRRSVHAT